MAETELAKDEERPAPIAWDEHDEIRATGEGMPEPRDGGE